MFLIAVRWKADSHWCTERVCLSNMSSVGEQNTIMVSLAGCGELWRPLTVPTDSMSSAIRTVLDPTNSIICTWSSGTVLLYITVMPLPRRLRISHWYSIDRIGGFAPQKLRCLWPITHALSANDSTDGTWTTSHHQVGNCSITAVANNQHMALAEFACILVCIFDLMHRLCAWQWLIKCLS